MPYSRKEESLALHVNWEEIHSRRILLRCIVCLLRQNWSVLLWSSGLRHTMKSKHRKKNTGGEGKLLEMIHVSAFPLDNWLCQNWRKSLLMIQSLSVLCSGEIFTHQEITLSFWIMSLRWYVSNAPKWEVVTHLRKYYILSVSRFWTKIAHLSDKYCIKMV